MGDHADSTANHILRPEREQGVRGPCPKISDRAGDAWTGQVRRKTPANGGFDPLVTATLAARFQKPLGGRLLPKAAPLPRGKSAERSSPAERSCLPGIKRRPVRMLASGHAPPNRCRFSRVGHERLHGGFERDSPFAHQSPGLFDVDFEPCTLFGEIIRRTPQGDDCIQNVLAATGTALPPVHACMVHEQRGDSLSRQPQQPNLPIPKSWSP